MVRYLKFAICALLLSVNAHAAVIFQDNFDSCTTNCTPTASGPPNSSSGWDSWVTWQVSDTVGGVTHYSAEITSPGRGGTGKSLKMWKANGVFGDYSGLNYTPSGSYNHFFMRYYIKIPSAFSYSGDVGYKLWRLNTTGGTNEVYLNNYYGTWSIYDGGSTGWVELLSGSQISAISDGNWHCIEFEFGLATSTLRMWVDDALVYSNTSRSWGAAGNLSRIQHFFIGNTYDHIGHWQSGWQSVEVDDFVLSTTVIGSSGGGTEPPPSDTTPPYASQWSPSKNATGVAITNRTIHFHIQDDTQVLQANGVVNIEGTNYTCAAGLSCSGNGTTDLSVTYTKGSDWSNDQVVNVITSGFSDGTNTMATDTWQYTIASDPGPGAPNITTTTLSAGTVGTSASQAFAATGGTSPYTWSLLSGTIPPGKTISSGGTYSGTPTTAGTYNFTVAIVDSIGGIDNQALSQVINPATPGGQTTVQNANFADTYIGGTDSSENFGSDNALRVYQWPAYTVANRIIVMDNADILSIPDNVSITAATLRLYMTGYEVSGGTNPMKVHAKRITGTVPDTTTVTGANFSGTVGADLSVTDVALTTGWYEWSVLSAVQAVYTTRSPLYLLLDGGSDGAADTNRIFASVDHATTAYHPQLVITYTQHIGDPGTTPSISAPGKMRVSKFKGKMK
jgi:hypothetical protein